MVETDIPAVLEARGKTHGPWEEQANLAQHLKTSYRNYIVDDLSLSYPQREALDMILHKISRIVVGDPNHKDHWDDISGYAQLIARGLKNG